MRSIKFPPFLQTNFKPSCWNVLDPNIHGVLHLVWSSMLHSDVNFRKRGKGLKMVNVVIPSFITRYIYTWIKMINLISNHEKGSFLNSCDVVTSARPFNQLKCVKKLDKMNVVLNYLFLCLLYRFLLKVAVNGFLFCSSACPRQSPVLSLIFDCLAKVQHGVNIVLFGRNFFGKFL